MSRKVRRHAERHHSHAVNDLVAEGGLVLASDDAIASKVEETIDSAMRVDPQQPAPPIRPGK